MAGAGCSQQYPWASSFWEGLRGLFTRLGSAGRVGGWGGGSSYPRKDLVCCPLPQRRGQPCRVKPETRALGGVAEPAAPAPTQREAGAGPRSLACWKCDLDAVSFWPGFPGSQEQLQRVPTKTRRPRLWGATFQTLRKARGASTGGGPSKSPGSWLEALTPRSPHSDFQMGWGWSLKCPQLFRGIRQRCAVPSLPQVSRPRGPDASRNQPASAQTRAV